MVFVAVFVNGTNTSWYRFCQNRAQALFEKQRKILDKQKFLETTYFASTLYIK